MILQTLRQAITQCFFRFGKRIEQRFKLWSQPLHGALLLGAVSDINRSKSEMIVENAFLRQQLIVLRRQTKRPTLTGRDRGVLVLLSSHLRTWQEALLIVKPDTLLRWHRQGLRWFWRQNSRTKPRSPRVSPDVIALIHTLAHDNRLWGVKRIQDELRKLGYHLSKRTVAKYIRQVRRPQPPRYPGQTWATFLANHAHEIWACDFLQTYDLGFRSMFVFFIIELSSRRVVHFAVTRSPSDAWVAQQLREATPFDTYPRFLIRDNDSKYSVEFARRQQDRGATDANSRPKANAVCERFLGSVRRECLDHILILNERQLRGKLKEYVTYFNTVRPHQGIAHRVPLPIATLDDPQSTKDKITAFPILVACIMTIAEALRAQFLPQMS